MLETKDINIVIDTCKHRQGDICILGEGTMTCVDVLQIGMCSELTPYLDPHPYVSESFMSEWRPSL